MSKGIGAEAAGMVLYETNTRALKRQSYFLPATEDIVKEVLTQGKRDRKKETT